MKISRRRKRYVLASVILALSIILMGCSGGSLPESFDETEVIDSAAMIIDLINAQDAQSLLELSTPRLQAAITQEVWEDVFATIREGGSFIALDSTHVRGITDRDSGEAYAIVTARARYEHKTFIYTISFTEDMNLAGVYYR